MKKVIIISVIVFLLLAGSAEAGTAIDTSDVYLMAYYNPGTEIDLSTAIEEFDYLTESTGQYVEGKLVIWYDDPQGRNPGNIQNFERRSNVDTNILLASNVTVRVRSDGWIAAWLTNDQDLKDIVFWDDANTANLPSSTTLGKAIWRITDRVGANYNNSEVKYYSFKYPDADRLLIGGRVTSDGIETYNLLMPSQTTVYDASHMFTVFLLKTIYPNSNYYIYGTVKMNESVLYSKNSASMGYYTGLYEYSRYYQDLTNFPKDTRHTITIESGGNVANSPRIIKSAVAVLYKSG